MANEVINYKLQIDDSDLANQLEQIRSRINDAVSQGSQVTTPASFSNDYGFSSPSYLATLPDVSFAPLGQIGSLGYTSGPSIFSPSRVLYPTADFDNSYGPTSPSAVFSNFGNNMSAGVNRFTSDFGSLSSNIGYMATSNIPSGGGFFSSALGSLGIGYDQHMPMSLPAYRAAEAANTQDFLTNNAADIASTGASMALSYMVPEVGLPLLALDALTIPLTSPWEDVNSVAQGIQVIGASNMGVMSRSESIDIANNMRKFVTSNREFDYSMSDIESAISNFDVAGGFQGVSGTAELKSKIDSVMQNFREVMHMLGTTQEEAAQIMGDLQNRQIVSSPDQVSSLIAGVTSKAYMSGLAPNDLLSFGLNTADMMSGTGYSQAGAFNYGIDAITEINRLSRSMDPTYREDVRSMGGTTAATGALMQYMQNVSSTMQGFVNNVANNMHGNNGSNIGNILGNYMDVGNEFAGDPNAYFAAKIKGNGLIEGQTLEQQALQSVYGSLDEMQKMGVPNITREGVMGWMLTKDQANGVPTSISNIRTLMDLAENADFSHVRVDEEGLRKNSIKLMADVENGQTTFFDRLKGKVVGIFDQAADDLGRPLWEKKHGFGEWVSDEVFNALHSNPIDASDFNYFTTDDWKTILNYRGSKAYKNVFGDKRTDTRALLSKKELDANDILDSSYDFSGNKSRIFDLFKDYTLGGDKSTKAFIYQYLGGNTDTDTEILRSNLDTALYLGMVNPSNETDALTVSDLAKLNSKETANWLSSKKTMGEFGFSQETALNELSEKAFGVKDYASLSGSVQDKMDQMLKEQFKDSYISRSDVQSIHGTVSRTLLDYDHSTPQYVNSVDLINSVKAKNDTSTLGYLRNLRGEAGQSDSVFTRYLSEDLSTLTHLLDWQTPENLGSKSIPSAQSGLALIQYSLGDSKYFEHQDENYWKGFKNETEFINKEILPHLFTDKNGKSLYTVSTITTKGTAEEKTKLADVMNYLEQHEGNGHLINKGVFNYDLATRTSDTVKKLTDDESGNVRYYFGRALAGAVNTVGTNLSAWNDFLPEQIKKAGIFTNQTELYEPSSNEFFEKGINYLKEQLNSTNSKERKDAEKILAESNRNMMSQYYDIIGKDQSKLTSEEQYRLSIMNAHAVRDNNGKVISIESLGAFEDFAQVNAYSKYSKEVKEKLTSAYIKDVSPIELDLFTQYLAQGSAQGQNKSIIDMNGEEMQGSFLEFRRRNFDMSNNTNRTEAAITAQNYQRVQDRLHTVFELQRDPSYYSDSAIEKYQQDLTAKQTQLDNLTKADPHNKDIGALQTKVQELTQKIADAKNLKKTPADVQAVSGFNAMLSTMQTAFNKLATGTINVALVDEKKKIGDNPSEFTLNVGSVGATSGGVVPMNFNTDKK